MKLVFFLSLGMLASGAGFGQFRNPQKVDRDSINTITREKILNDLDEYADGIAHKHFHPFSHIKKSVFYEQIQLIKDSAARYNVDELLVRLMQVNALIEDEHTNIEYITPNIFPFTFFWFEEGIYIKGTNEENRKLLGSKLIAVNDIPVSEAVDKITTLMPDKNPQNIKSEIGRYLCDPFVLHGLQLSAARNNVVYTFVGPANDTLKIAPKAIDWRKIKMLCECDNKKIFKNSDSSKHWFKYIDTGNYIYFKYASCYDDKQHPFRKVEEALVKEIDEKKPQKIIIDMRDNGGGYPRMLWPFINSLSRSPLNKKGGIYVLIGRNTFSAGILNSVSLKDQTYAKLVGEETSGSTSFFGGVQWFVLPETKLRIMYSTGYVATSENYKGSLKPDIIIPVTFADYDKEIDAALQYAIAH